MSKMTKFIKETKSLREEIRSLVEQYNEIGRDYFGEDWIKELPNRYLNVMISTDKLIDFKPDPKPAAICNALTYRYSNEYDDFFEGVVDGTKICEVMPREVSPIEEERRNYI